MSNRLRLDIHGVLIPHGEERYVIVYTAQNLDRVYRQLGRWASDPNLSFSWYDAACASKQIREEQSK